MSSDHDRDVMISVRGLGKAYTIAHAAQKATTLAEAAVSRLRRPFYRPQQETFWALKDVSFDVRRGDVVGVIGRNGAGKSTLFKILSRITEPTTGQVDLYGRVGSLLEVGTGFSGELTGRENIYLNGTILGMRRSEIAKRFDEIVDFAGVEKFLDTAVKRYSSGMYVRLAFAVAAHLETDILIVDEVLAVGDATFQQRCLAKIREVAHDSGRTALLVSHNIGVIRSICSRCVLLRNGTLTYAGATADAAAMYAQEVDQMSLIPMVSRDDRFGTGGVSISSVRICEGSNGPYSARVVAGQPATISITVMGNLPATVLWLAICTPEGDRIAEFTTSHASPVDDVSVGWQVLRCLIDSLSLTPGRYRIDAAVTIGSEVLDAFKPAIFFDVESGEIGGRRVEYLQDRTLIHLAHRFQTA
jgi:lipopolysaccharide transport system ATP-binding protein